MNIDWQATAIALLTFFGIYALMALSLNLEYGVAGIPNFGQAAFISFGAYTAGVLYTRLLPLLAGRPFIPPCGDTITTALQLRTDIINSNPAAALETFFITLIIAAIFGAVVGYLVSYPALRLKEEWYLALALLVGSEVVRIVVNGFSPIICGNNGLAGIGQPFLWLKNPTLSSLALLVLILVLLVAAFILNERLIHSPYGRMLKAIRENDRIALALGKRVPRVRAQVMFIGSAIAAVAGVLFAVNLGFVNTNDYGVALTLNIWVMVVLGGLGNPRGALVGALIVTLLTRLTAILAIYLNQSGIKLEFNYVQYIVFALILLVMLRFRRQGLLPERSQTTIAHDELRQV
ncbi:MAG TPA: branched-chain amino acid ABC transporter permease [Anaerolineae bacterium]|nr:branched-chain amino acid ABC transporter permease [Anaerolineae bacterium]